MKRKKRKMRGHNQVLISGTVEGKMVSGTTGDGGSAFSFSVASTDSGRKAMRVRVNAYDQTAEQCNDEARRGSYCIVIGELMNRSGKFGKLTEIRAKTVEFISDIDNEESGGTDGGQEDGRQDRN
jgi:single-stranded DNA-binding protein